MPIYEYRCAACGHQQEFLQKVSDAPMTVCTKCGKPAFEKMVTAAGFQLKGSGWYATDFKNSGSKPASSATTPAKGSDDAKAGGDAKPAADAKPATDAKPASDSSSAASTSTPAPAVPPAK
jgi:putative FmdB family regulatory protein